VSRLLYIQRTQSLKPSTPHFAVHLLDRVLTKRDVQRSQDSFHLLATVLIKIASDYREDPLRLEHIWLGDGAWYKRVEKEVVAILGHQLDWPGPFAFLDQYLASTVCYKSDASKLRALAAFLLEVSLFNNRIASQPPSVVAAAAYCMAVTMLEGGPWVRCY
jgi:hypothetical protein